MFGIKTMFAVGAIFAVVASGGGPEITGEPSYIDAEYVEMCEEVGQEYGICPYILVALIERESSGNPDAENGPCKGLCQISEKWHTARMEKLGVTDIYDPEGNIRLAADYLMEMAEDGAEIATALGTYHGEPNAETKISSYTSGILARSEEMERFYYSESY